MNSFYVYAHIRPDKNQVFYIGKGCRKRAYARDNRSTIWKSIVRKNNNQFLVQMLHTELSEQEALSKEIELISTYGRICDNTGCLSNLTLGGDGVSGHKMTDQSKEKMRLAKIGRPSSWKGKSPSKKTRLKMRISAKNRSSNRKGKGSPSIRRKIVNTLTGEVVAVGTKDFIEKGLANGKSYKTIVNYFSGWKRKPEWFTYQNSQL